MEQIPLWLQTMAILLSGERSQWSHPHRAAGARSYLLRCRAERAADREGSIHVSSVVWLHWFRVNYNLRNIGFTRFRSLDQKWVRDKAKSRSFSEPLRNLDVVTRYLYKGGHSQKSQSAIL